MREARGWSQDDLGEKAGMAQGRVSKLEDPDYSGVTLKTLKRIGEALDVALLVEYVPFRELLERTQKREHLLVPSYEEDLATAVGSSVNYVAVPGHGLSAGQAAIS